MTDKFITNYNLGVKNTGLHEGVINILHQFEQQQKGQYILTAAPTEMVVPLLDRFEINHYFDKVEGVDNNRAEGKVNLGIQLIQNHQFERKQTVLIGDTYHDFEVTNAMEIDCILVANGHQSKERLVDFTKGKILVVNELSQLF